MGDAVVGGIDIAQKASQLARQLQGTALESSFKDRVLKMITVRASDPPARALPSQRSPSSPSPSSAASRASSWIWAKCCSTTLTCSAEFSTHRETRHGSAATPPPPNPGLTPPQVPVWEKYAQIVASDENPEFMNMKLMGGTETEVRQLHVGFEGQLGTHVSRRACALVPVSVASPPPRSCSTPGPCAATT
jgi:hypothetical protein